MCLQSSELLEKNTLKRGENLNSEKLPNLFKGYEKIMNQQIFRSFAKDSLKENRKVCSFKLPNYLRRNIWKREESYVSLIFRILAKDHLDDRRKLCSSNLSNH